MLFGSNIFSAHVFIESRSVQLGDIVRRSFEDSGLLADQWNLLTEEERDLMLVRTFYQMRREA